MRDMELGGRKVGRRTGKSCYLVAAMFWSTQWMEVDLSGAFYRSLVACDAPVPTADGSCPAGTQYRVANTSDDAFCEPLPRGSDNWSGSAHCFDKMITITRSVQIGGQLSTLNIFGSVLATTILGMPLIDSWGRKPCMVLSLVGYCVCCLVFALACYFGGTMNTFTTQLLFFGIMLASMLNTFEAASGAMAADGTDPTNGERSESIALLSIGKTAGILCGFFIGFFILQADLVDYTAVWLVFGLLIFLFTCISSVLLQETKPMEGPLDELSARPGLRASLHASCRKLRRDLCIAFRLIGRDPVLRIGCCLSGSAFGFSYGAIGLSGGWAILFCGYSQAIASLSGMLQPAFIIVGSALAGKLSRSIGMWNTMFVGSFFVIAGFTLVGLGGIFPDYRRVLYWLGWGAVTGTGFGIVNVATASVMSARVRDEDLGKTFSALGLVGGSGMAIGVFVFSNILINPNDPDHVVQQMFRGWFIAAAGIALVTLGWAYVYRRYVASAQAQ